MLAEWAARLWPPLGVGHFACQYEHCCRLCNTSASRISIVQQVPLQVRGSTPVTNVEQQRLQACRRHVVNQKDNVHVDTTLAGAVELVQKSGSVLQTHVTSNDDMSAVVNTPSTY